MPSELHPNSTFSVMNKVMNNFKKQSKIRLIELVNENVIRFPDQNTLNTNTKQIRNPQKEISGGFFMVIIRNARKKNKI